MVGAIEPKLRQAEIERAQRKRPESLDAYDFYLRSLPLAFTSMPDDADKALDLLKKAIDLEPEYPAAHAVSALCYEQRYMRGGQIEADRTAGIRHARAAIAAGRDDATALALGGFVIGVLEQDHDTALHSLDRSLSLCPSFATALGFSSVNLHSPFRASAWSGMR